MEDIEYQVMADQQQWHWWYRAKRRYLQLVLDRLKLPPTARLLDLGCGVGANLSLLAQYGRVEGLDAHPLAVQYSQRHWPQLVRQQDLNQWQPAAAEYDLITLLDVLYHQGVVSDREVIAKCLTALKPAGYLIITDCLHPWLFGPHDRANHARQRYTRDELVSTVCSAGGVITWSSCLFASTFPGFVLQRLWQRWRGVSDDHQTQPGWLNSLLLHGCTFDLAVLKAHPLPFGSSILLVVRRPNR